jgi:hypothetical protein
MLGLALLTEVYRRGPAIGATGPIGRLPSKSARALLAAAPDAGLEQLAALRVVMESTLLFSARYGYLAQWKLGTLLPQLAGKPVATAAERAEFRALLGACRD